MFEMILLQREPNTQTNKIYLFFIQNGDIRYPRLFSPVQKSR
jgi:hypothetical protein